MKYIIGNKDVDASFINLSMWVNPNHVEIKKQIGMSVPSSIIEIIRGRTLIYHIDSTRAPVFISQCLNQLLKNPKLITHLIKNTEIVTKQIRQLSSNYIKKVDKLKDSEIIQLLKKLDNLQSKATTFGLVIAFADIQGEISNLLTDIIKKRKSLKHQSYVYTESLTCPVKMGLSEKAYLDIKKSKASLDSLTQKYFWLNQGYIGRGLSKSDVIKLRQEKRSDKKSIYKAALEKELKFSSAERKIFSIAEQIIYGKILRIDSRQFAHVVINKIIDMYACKLGIDAKYLETLSVDEFCGAIGKKQEIPKDINEKWRHSLVCFNKQRYKYKMGNDVETFLMKNSVAMVKNKLTEIKGQIAQMGKVQGRVCLVFGPQHIAKMRKDNILVAMATSPQLLPAMKKAAAFVTDVGGITSHAAIVSRELNIPCIVGTKVATQVFKDGDLVEVDANKGVVKKLV